MAINDQQNEKARINLEYKSKIQGGRSVKLPYRMMVLGDFSPNHAEKEKAIGDRRSWQIDKSTFNQVMSEMAPTIELTVENKLEETDGEPKMMGVKLDFKNRDDFHPEKLIEMVPELKELASIRDLVKDLRSRMVRSDDLRKAVEAVLRDPEKRKKLEQELTTRRQKEE
ncbi:type VI secretion system contractile sheath small subunit [bacterium]|jgi:type VI secretion system protein ImpB|nr:type VI secretion system contractile sheath small subunit [bacterium]